MHCLVTGGAGFIGSHLCTALLEAGHSVVALDDLSSGKAANIANLHYHSAFTFKALDVRALADSDLRGVEAVFHLAASKKNICLHDPVRDLNINGSGTLHLALAAARCGVQHFIHASTGSVYGNIIPQSEQARTVPVSYYGISKLAGENYVRLVGATQGLKTTILRYFHVYGPRQDASDERGGVIAIWLRHIFEGTPLTLHGDGTQQRCFTYVQDVVRANLLALERARGGEIFNCVSTVRVELNRVLELLFYMTGRRVPILSAPTLPGDIAYFQPTSGLIRNALGLRFTSLVDGLEETVNVARESYSEVQG